MTTNPQLPHGHRAVVRALTAVLAIVAPVLLTSAPSIAAGPSTISGRVLDPAGVPVQGATVTASGAGTGSVQTGPDGTYEVVLNVTTPGPVSVSVEPSGASELIGPPPGQVDVTGSGDAHPSTDVTLVQGYPITISERHSYYGTVTLTGLIACPSPDIPSSANTCRNGSAPSASRIVSIAGFEVSALLPLGTHRVAVVRTVNNLADQLVLTDTSVFVGPGSESSCIAGHVGLFSVQPCLWKPGTGDVDGVAAQVEAAAPHGGDGNGDGTPDADQDGVASLMTSKGGVTVVASSGYLLVDVREVGNPPPLPNGETAALGPISFTVVPQAGVGALPRATTVDILPWDGVHGDSVATYYLPQPSNIGVWIKQPGAATPTVLRVRADDDTTVVALDDPTTEPAAPYVGISPVRLMDTRSEAPPIGPMPRVHGIGLRTAGSVTRLRIAGEEAPAGAVAAALNIAITGPAAGGFVTAWACGTMPTAASLNFAADATVSNNVIASLDPVTGEVCLYTSATTHLVVDLQGWFPPGSGYGTTGPTRAMDTRIGLGLTSTSGSGANIGPRAAGSILNLPIEGRNGLPGDVGAVVLNVAVDRPFTGGFLTVFRCEWTPGSGSVPTPPNAATLNFAAGQTTSNGAVVPVARNAGGICIYTSATTDIIVDINGYTTEAAAFTPVQTSRLLETRTALGLETVDGLQQGIGRRLAGSATVLQVANRTVPISYTLDQTRVLPGTRVVALNLAVTNPATDGFLTAYPCNSTRPLTSNLNFRAGETVSNGAFVATGGSDVCIYVSATTDVVVDITGYTTLF